MTLNVNQKGYFANEGNIVLFEDLSDPNSYSLVLPPIEDPDGIKYPITYNFYNDNLDNDENKSFKEIISNIAVDTITLNVKTNSQSSSNAVDVVNINSSEYKDSWYATANYIDSNGNLESLDTRDVQNSTTEIISNEEEIITSDNDKNYLISINSLSENGNSWIKSFGTERDDSAYSIAVNNDGS